MKQHIIIFILGLLATCPVINASELTAAADSAYLGKNYIEAAKLYQAEIDSVGPSSALYYNIGNCYYRTGSIPRAILNYERALKLNPRNKDAKANLDFINSRLTDRPGERGTFLGSVVDAVASTFSANAWAIIAIVCFALFGAGVLLYFFAGGVHAQKTGFFGGGIMLLLAIVAVIFGLRAAALASATDRAVVIAPSVILSTAPRVPTSAAEEAFMLHEGSIVEILDEVNVKNGNETTTWLDVEFDNSHRAWINADAVEVI